MNNIIEKLKNEIYSSCGIPSKLLNNNNESNSLITMRLQNELFKEKIKNKIK